MSTEHVSRRTAIGAGAAALGTLALTEVSTARAAAANEQFVIGVIGPGGMGTNHLKNLVKYPDVRIAYVCDVDATRAANAAKLVESAGGAAPQAVQDLRRVLDDKSVDAVWI